jgi:hypothetical protein
MALPRSRAARIAAELVPIAGDYGALCTHKKPPGMEEHGASDRGYAGSGTRLLRIGLASSDKSCTLTSFSPRAPMRSRMPWRWD